jgi:hypothetical protein
MIVFETPNLSNLKSRVYEDTKALVMLLLD